MFEILFAMPPAEQMKLVASSRCAADCRLRPLLPLVTGHAAILEKGWNLH